MDSDVPQHSMRDPKVQGDHASRILACLLPISLRGFLETREAEGVPKLFLKGAAPKSGTAALGHGTVNLGATALGLQLFFAQL